MKFIRKGNESAVEVVREHPERNDFRNIIIDTALEKINCSQEVTNHARDIVVKNALQYKNFAECSIELAKNGTRHAKKIINYIIEHPENDVFRYIIADIASEEIKYFQEVTNHTKDIVLQNALQYEIFAECTLKLAKNGNSQAQKIIIKHLEKNIFRELIIEIAIGKINSSQEMINLAQDTILKDPYGELAMGLPYIHDMRNKLWQELLKKNGLSNDMMRQNRCSYQKEYGKLSKTEGSVKGFSQK